jgi:hypothetical protein
LQGVAQGGTQRHLLLPLAIAGMSTEG